MWQTKCNFLDSNSSVTEWQATNEEETRKQCGRECNKSFKSNKSESERCTHFLVKNNQCRLMSGYEVNIGHAFIEFDESVICGFSKSYCDKTKNC